jgi:prepilin-type N-terminal cleavage/methylation domain-containing protein
MKISTEKGMTLIELMIAIVIVAIGIGGTTILLVSTISSNSRSNTSTTSALLAQMVLEEIGAQDVNSTQALQVTDCAGNVWTIADTAGTAGTGNGATLTSNGSIDFTQSQGTLLANDYAMNYVDCSSAGGSKMVYDIRWNVMSVSSNTTSRMITTAAKPAVSGAKQLGGALFAIPVTLRGIGAAPAGK